MSTIKSVSILGCGWYGFALAENLLKIGYKVKGSTTSTDKLTQLKRAGIEPFMVDFGSNQQLYNPDFFDCDLLIISIPPRSKTGEGNLYPNKISLIKAAIVRFGIKRVLFISSTGVYGDNNTTVDEDTVPQPKNESGKNIRSAEQIIQNVLGANTSILRFGGLIGPGRDPARFFAGKKNISNGKAPVNLIHLDDCIGVTLSIIEKDAFGYTFNACSQSHPTKMEFYKKAAIKSGLEVPEFIDELKDWKIVSSKYLEPVLNYKISDL